jgi:endonuclease/exonuclease/phosphatase family metal-dependent hydrolase
MKIATYNIMSGGFGNYSLAAPVTKPARLALLVQAVRGIGADFIGLVDAFRWKALFKTEELQETFGYREAIIINLEDKDKERPDREFIGLAALTNLPVISAETVRLGTRNCLKVRLKVGGQLLDVFTVYLTDLSEGERRRQAVALLAAVDRAIPTILLGDFNALAPEDRKFTRERVEEFLKVHPEFRERPDYRTYFEPLFRELLKAEVVPLIEHASFEDLAGQGGGQPTAWTQLSPFGLVAVARVDYIFASSGVRGRNFQVRRGGVFETASDHYPVIAEVFLNPDSAHPSGV